MQLLADPRATLEDRLQNLSLLKQDQETELASSLQALQKQSATNAAAICGVAGWMIGNGLAAEALAWLQGLPVNMRLGQPVPVALTDCYVAKEDWAGLEDFLKGESWDELDFLRLAYRSRAAERQDDTLMAAAHWRMAVREASDRFGTLALLLQLAERWQRQQDKEDLLWRIVERFPSQRWALRELDRIYAAGGNTRGQNKVYAAMLAMVPTDVALKNNVAATSLLLKTNLRQAHELAREVYEEGKTNAVFVSTYAYSLHVQGKTDEALRLMRTIPETSLREPAIAVYYATLLAAAGERKKAGVYFGAAEKGPLLPEERQLLAEVPR
jgi:tetratricopeptide (TPR) repeat protein